MLPRNIISINIVTGFIKKKVKKKKESRWETENKNGINTYCYEKCTKNGVLASPRVTE
jgi:hypothetical protein